jgi:hypothetical protein
MREDELSQQHVNMVLGFINLCVAFSCEVLAFACVLHRLIKVFKVTCHIHSSKQQPHVILWSCCMDPRRDAHMLVMHVKR